MHDLIGNTTFAIPRGTPGLSSINLNMTEIYEGEKRLAEVRTVNPLTAPELMGYFNQICNTTTKYIAWIEYETLQAKKYLDLAKSVVILEKAPEAFKKFKDSGIKYNEDFREAFIAQDSECQARLDVVNHLAAAKAFLESKAWSFVRAYNACKYVATNRSTTAASPNFSGTIGQTYDTPQDNFMGKTRLD